MMDDGLSGLRALTDHARALDHENLPAPTRDYARLLFLDTLGVVVGGSQAREVSRLAQATPAWPHLSGGSTLLGHTQMVAPMRAALVNGISATWLDCDAGHRPPKGTPLLAASHPPVHLVPAILATAEAIGADGAAILRAFIAGYEVAGRVEMAMRLDPAVHPHGTFPTLGAAAAVAVLRGCSGPEVFDAVRLAANLMLMPSFASAYEGRTIRNAWAGMGASAGMLAVDLALAGFVPESHPEATVLGSIMSPHFRTDELLDELGSRFEIELGFMKPFPSCRFSHPAIEAAEILRDTEDYSPADIDSVTIHTFDLAVTLDETEPQSELGAKFSIPFCVATMLVRGSAAPDDFREPGLSDPDVRRVCALTTVREDPSHSAVAPADRPARIEVHLRDGRRLVAERERSAGGPDQPWDPLSVRTKFRSLTSSVLGQETRHSRRSRHSTNSETRDISAHCCVRRRRRPPARRTSLRRSASWHRRRRASDRTPVSRLTRGESALQWCRTTPGRGSSQRGTPAPSYPPTYSRSRGAHAGARGTPPRRSSDASPFDLLDRAHDVEPELTAAGGSTLRRDRVVVEPRPIPVEGSVIGEVQLGDPVQRDCLGRWGRPIAGGGSLLDHRVEDDAAEVRVGQQVWHMNVPEPAVVFRTGQPRLDVVADKCLDRHGAILQVQLSGPRANPSARSCVGLTRTPTSWARTSSSSRRGASARPSARLASSIRR
jgi:2-methylcitrate dehydratase PrpD